MKILKFYLGILFLSLLVAGCSKDDGDKEKVVEMTIYPETGYGASIMSNIWTQPLVFSDNDDNQPQMLVDIITEGFDFDYQRGYEYKLKVKKVWMKEPPQDVSSIKYIFIELLSKVKVITQDSEENLEIFVSPETVKFMPKYPLEYNTDEMPVVYDALKVKVRGSDSWIILPEIEGFNYEPGYEYTLRVKKVTQADPYTVKYILLDILTKIP